MTVTVLLGSVSVFALSLTEPDTTVEQNLVSVINHTCASPAVTSRNVSRETNILRAEQKSQTRRTFSPELLFSWKSWKVWCVLVESRVCSALFLWAWDSYIRQVEQAVCVQFRMSAVGRFRHTRSSRVLLGSGGVCCTSRQYLRGPELQWRVILRVLVLTSVLWTRFHLTWQQKHVESCCTAISPEVTCGRRAAVWRWCYSFYCVHKSIIDQFSSPFFFSAHQPAVSVKFRTDNTWKSLWVTPAHILMMCCLVVFICLCKNNFSPFLTEFLLWHH